jgi:hypothetical protein
VSRETELKKLHDLLDHADELRDDERAAFDDMRRQLVSGERQHLSQDQNKWVRERHEQVVPVYENAWSAGKVPKGKDVPTPKVLQNLPLRPPSKPRVDE